VDFITTILLIAAAFFMSLAMIGYAAKQWRKLKRGS